jgi:hypothetical protein
MGNFTCQIFCFALLSKFKTSSWSSCVEYFLSLVSCSHDKKVGLNNQDTEVVSMIWSSVMGAVEWNKKEDLVLVSSLFYFSFVSLYLPVQFSLSGAVYIYMRVTQWAFFWHLGFSERK